MMSLDAVKAYRRGWVNIYSLRLLSGQQHNYCVGWIARNVYIINSRRFDLSLPVNDPLADCYNVERFTWFKHTSLHLDIQLSPEQLLY